MRVEPKLLLVLIGMVLDATCAVAAEPRQLEPGATLTLKPRKTKYFLGENIILDYRISYDGDGRFWFNSTTGLGTGDCTVIATDQAGREVEASTREYYCNGSGGLSIGRGDSISFTIPLSYYCRLEKAGTYRIRAAHNLLWKGDPRIPKDDPRWAETTIEVVMPDAAQAKKVVEEMCRLKTDINDCRHSTWNTEDYADFTCLQPPVYLPILEKMAFDQRGDPRALLGLSHNPAPEATEILLRLLKDANNDRAERIIAALCDRLPDPPGFKRGNRQNPYSRSYAGTTWFYYEDADPKLVKKSWRNDLARPMRELACKLLKDDESLKVQSGAYILESIGGRDDIAELTAAATRLVPLVEKAELPKYHGELAASRRACNDVAFAIEALAIRGVEPVAEPKTPGEIIHFVLMLKRSKSFRPANWEKKCEEWVLKASPYVREFVLFNLPQPLPEALMEPYREAVRKVLGLTREQSVLHGAVQLAVRLEIPVDEIMERLVDRVDAENSLLYAHIHACLSNLLESGDHNGSHAACTRPLKAKEMAAFKAAWKQFLNVNGPAIRNGKRYSLVSDEILHLMHPTRTKDE